MTHSENSTAIVTGASRGIGAEIAGDLAANGFAVVVNYANGAAEADAVVEAIAAAGGRAVAACADLSLPGSEKTLFDAAEKAFGPVGVLVNNAGIMRLSPVAETGDEQFERQVAVNLGGPFRMMREAANRLSEGGRIVNFSSSVVGLYQPATPPMWPPRPGWRR